MQSQIGRTSHICCHTLGLHWSFLDCAELKLCRLRNQSLTQIARASGSYKPGCRVENVQNQLCLKLATYAPWVRNCYCERHLTISCWRFTDNEFQTNSLLVQIKVVLLFFEPNCLEKIEVFIFKIIGFISWPQLLVVLGLLSTKCES